MEKYIVATVASVASYFAPVEPLLLCAVVFVAIDFLTGILADRAQARRNNTPWLFASHKAWKTIRKLFFVMGGIVLAFMLDQLLAPMATLRLANIFTGFVCGVEFWSYLENASTATGENIFHLFAHHAAKRLKKKDEKAQ